MKPDYLILTDGRKVRVEVNMNSLGEFTAITGKELTDFNKMKADINTLRTIACCAMKEGEDIDGRQFDLDEKSFGRLMGISQIKDFAIILTSQSRPAEQKKSEPPKKMKQLHTR